MRLRIPRLPMSESCTARTVKPASGSRMAVIFLATNVMAILVSSLSHQTVCFHTHHLHSHTPLWRNVMPPPLTSIPCLLRPRYAWQPVNGLGLSECNADALHTTCNNHNSHLPLPTAATSTPHLTTIDTLLCHFTNLALSHPQRYSYLVHPRAATPTPWRLPHAAYRHSQHHLPPLYQPTHNSQQSL